MEIIPMKPRPFGGKNMKTLLSIVMTVVLTAALLTGCGCTNRNMETTPEPTVLPTNEEIWNTTEATRSPTVTTTEPTVNTTLETRDNVTNSTETTGTTTPTEDPLDSRARRMIPDMR